MKEQHSFPSLTTILLQMQLTDQCKNNDKQVRSTNDLTQSYYHESLSAAQPHANDILFWSPPRNVKQQQLVDDGDSAGMVQFGLKNTAHHTGNEQWALLVAANRDMYQTLAKQNSVRHQRLLAESIVLAIHRQQPAGRFLAWRHVRGVDRNNETKTYAPAHEMEWYDVGFEVAVALTTHALMLSRDG